MDMNEAYIPLVIDRSDYVTNPNRLDPYSVRYHQAFNNGLGDRDRSPSPEGEVTWDIIQSTLTPHLNYC